MDSKIKLSEIERDAIKEVGNVGTGNAATALSKLTGKKIEMIIPETQFIELENFTNLFGGPESMVVSVYLQVMEDLNGEAVLMFGQDDAKKMVDLVMRKPLGTTKVMDDMAQSAFKEMSTIFTGSYLNALSDMFNLKILPSLPYFAVDMAQSIVDFILAKISNYADKVLCINTQIKVEDVEIKGDFVLIFDVESFNKMLTILRRMYGGGA